MKRTLALAVACALVLEGCGESDAPGEARKKTVLEYASMKDIRNINPHLYLGEMAAQAMVFEPLVFNTPEGVKPALAERWEISGDGRTYTFHLRRGVKFTDGTPFTADAVKKNIDAVMANRTRHAWLDMINEIESSEVVDEHTWRLHLRHPYFPALIELGLSRPFRFISPACMKDGGTKDGVTCLAGTGPWVLSEHKDQQYALFSRNEGYWGDKPIVPTVRWNVVPDTQTMLMALEKGEIDLVFGADGDQLTGDAFKKLTDEKRLNPAVSEPIASRAILVNSKRPITKDVRTDMLAIPEVLGVKIALGDHRSSFPNQHEIMQILADVRVSGMLTGKTGFLHVHLGDFPYSFDIFDECVAQGMPIKHIRPTHVARHPAVFERAMGFAKQGGWIDITTGGGNYMGSAADAVRAALADGVPFDRITLSSDGHGSMPRFNEAGEMVGLGVGSIMCNIETVQELARRHDLTTALLPMTRTVAEALTLEGKGVIEVGADADLLILNAEHEITDVFMGGVQCMRAGEVIVKGAFEE